MYEEKKLECMFSIIAIVLTIVAVAAIAFALLWISKAVDSYQYNNGICRKCGGTYEYIETVGSYHGAVYIYGCDKCKHRIEQDEYHYKGE